MHEPARTCVMTSARNVVPAMLAASFILAIGHAMPAHAQTNAEDNCHKGCPLGAPASNEVIAREIYALSNNPNSKLADWVAYRVQTANLGGNKKRGSFKKEPQLDADETLVPADYDHANVTLGVDRGHQAPFASFKKSDDAQDTNFLSNITPQFTKLNQGAWKNLEEAARQLAKDNPSGKVFVMTGPLYEWPMAKLPAINKDHEVPSAYWKVIALVEGNTTNVSAFYFYQDTPKRADYCDHAKAVDFIEQKSGLDFFSGMPDADEEPLESSDPTLVSELGC